MSTRSSNTQLIIKLINGNYCMILIQTKLTSCEPFDRVGLALESAQSNGFTDILLEPEWSS